MKKTLALLCIILGTCSLAALAAAGDVPAIEYESGDYTYTVNTDGNAVITYYIGDDERVAVPAVLDGYPVAGIGAWAFPNFGEIVSVSLPAGIQAIDDAAFDECYGLSSIEVSQDNPAYYSIDGVLFRTEDGALIAYPLGKTNEVYIVPQGTKSLSEKVFCDCCLTSVILPGSLQAIGDEAYQYGSNLLFILVSPDNPAYYSIDGVLFRTEDSALLVYPPGRMESAYSVPQGTEALADQAFTNCFIQSVALPNSLRTIGNQAFLYCSSLESVNLPDGLVSIGAEAFAYCQKLTISSLPGSLRSIGDGAFAFCPAVASMSIPPDHPVFAFIDGVLFDTVNNVLIAYPAEKAGETYDVAQTVRSISGEAFAGCSSLASVSLPDGLESIADSTFSDCASLASVSLPGSLRSIGDRAFEDCESLSSVSLPNGLQSIGAWAFAGCDALASADLPYGVKTVAEGTFYNCPALASVSLPDGLASIGNWAFSCCSSLESIDLPDGLRTIGNGAFSESALTSVSLPDGVVSIGEEAFKYCESLTSVSLPDSLKSIGDEAFSVCTQLASISLPAGLGYIGNSAFTDCDLLTSIEVSPDNPMFSSIDGVLFDKVNHTLFTYPPGNPEESYAVPQGTLALGRLAFDSCVTLTSVSLPDGLLSIDGFAFYDCGSLTSVSLPASVQAIDDEAFVGNDALTLIVPRNSYAHQYAEKREIPYQYSAH